MEALEAGMGTGWGLARAAGPSPSPGGPCWTSSPVPGPPAPACCVAAFASHCLSWVQASLLAWTAGMAQLLCTQVLRPLSLWASWAPCPKRYFQNAGESGELGLQTG